MPPCAVVLLLLSAILLQCRGHEFTFELPDNEKMCFYEALKKEVKCIFEYQVSDELKGQGSRLVRENAKLPGKSGKTR